MSQWLPLENLVIFLYFLIAISIRIHLTPTSLLSIQFVEYLWNTDSYQQRLIFCRFFFILYKWKKNAFSVKFEQIPTAIRISKKSRIQIHLLTCNYSQIITKHLLYVSQNATEYMEYMASSSDMTLILPIKAYSSRGQITCRTWYQSKGANFKILATTI